MPRLATTSAGAANDEGGLTAIWQELQLRNWPVRELEERLTDLLDLSSSLLSEHRGQWLDALRRVWEEHGWALRAQGRAGLLELASAWCDWPLAAAVGEALGEGEELDDTSSLLLIRAYRQMGDADSALALAVVGQIAKPADTRYADAYRELAEWCAWRESWSRIDGVDHGDDELALEPLGFHHLCDFAWQYHDPAVAELCCLPTFPGDDQWREWLVDIYRLGDQRIYAVMHATLGFVGNVSLIQHGGLGFFYYWLGPDFQGRGLGPRAVALLLAQAEQAWGLECCYAKVYEHNAHSRRALEKLGFEELGIAAVSPNDDEVFYRRGEPAARERIVGELHWLLAAMDSETRAAALLATP